MLNIRPNKQKALFRKALPAASALSCRAPQALNVSFPPFAKSSLGRQLPLN